MSDFHDGHQNGLVYLWSSIAAAMGGAFTWASRRRRRPTLTLESHSQDMQRWVEDLRDTMKELNTHLTTQTGLLQRLVDLNEEMRNMVLQVWKKVG